MGAGNGKRVHDEQKHFGRFDRIINAGDLAADLLKSIQFGLKILADMLARFFGKTIEEVFIFEEG